jgi:hypothetical protein
MAQHLVLGVNLSWVVIIIGATIITGIASRLVVHASASPGLFFSGTAAASEGQIHAGPPPASSIRLVPPPASFSRLAVRGARFEWNGQSPVFLSGINQPWLSYGHDFGRDRGVAHYCQMRQVLLNASRVRTRCLCEPPAL